MQMMRLLSLFHILIQIYLIYELTHPSINTDTPIFPYSVEEEVE